MIVISPLPQTHVLGQKGQLSHLRGPRALHLLPQQDDEVGEGEQRSEHITNFVLQRVAEQQGIKEQRIVENGDYLHVL